MNELIQSNVIDISCYFPGGIGLTRDMVSLAITSSHDNLQSALIVIHVAGQDRQREVYVSANHTFIDTRSGAGSGMAGRAAAIPI